MAEDVAKAASAGAAFAPAAEGGPVGQLELRQHVRDVVLDSVDRDAEGQAISGFVFPACTSSSTRDSAGVIG
jgi:hypothetical protein